jgi:hypothetical protein
MTSMRYRIYTDTVPFLPYVLSGVMDKYSPYQNFISGSKVELLKMIDYGIYPSYLITSQSAYELQKTELQAIYSSSFSTWEGRIKSDCDFLKNGLSAISGAYVKARSQEALGVYKITYSNNVTIYVNYTNDTVNVDSQSLDALSYKVVT